MRSGGQDVAFERLPGTQEPTAVGARADVGTVRRAIASLEQRVRTMCLVTLRPRATEHREHWHEKTERLGERRSAPSLAGSIV